MDERLLERISEVSFFYKAEIAEFIRKECAAEKEDIFCLANGTVCYKSYKESGGILLIFRFKPDGVIAETSDSQCRISVLGGVKEENAADRICYSESKPIGILRKSGEKDGTVLEMFQNLKSETGVVYEFNKELQVCGDTVCGEQLSALTIYIAVQCIKKLKESGKNAAVALVNESLCGESGLAEAVRNIKPDAIFVVSATEENDVCKLGKGAAVLVKDGNCVVPENMRTIVQNAAVAIGQELQYFVGKTDTGMERVSISGDTGNFCGIYLTAKHTETRMKEADAKDVEKTQNLILKIIDMSDII